MQEGKTKTFSDEQKLRQYNASRPGRLSIFKKFSGKKEGGIKCKPGSAWRDAKHQKWECRVNIKFLTFLLLRLKEHIYLQCITGFTTYEK